LKAGVWLIGTMRRRLEGVQAVSAGVDQPGHLSQGLFGGHVRVERRALPTPAWVTAACLAYRVSVDGVRWAACLVVSAAA